MIVKPTVSELLEKVGRYGTLPPKMASVASSSRFCYLALRDGGTGLSGSGQVQFEHECRIKGITGTAPQLDAYIPNENIYVEAKCHEIFDLHKIKMSIKYWEYIFGNDNDFGLPALKKPDIDTFEIPVSIFGVDKENTMFDTKQFLCHLLGIASQKQHSEEAKLVYLFFKPKSRVEEIASEVDEIFSELKQEMTSIFNCAYIKKFITKHNIKLTAIAEYAEIMGPLIDQNALILISV